MPESFSDTKQTLVNYVHAETVGQFYQLALQERCGVLTGLCLVESFDIANQLTAQQIPVTAIEFYGVREREAGKYIHVWVVCQQQRFDPPSNEARFHLLYRRGICLPEIKVQWLKLRQNGSFRLQ
jgi:hypothetical protein